MPDGIGNETQVRIVAEQIAEAAVTKFALLHPEIGQLKAEIPLTMKWLAGIASALLVLACGGTATWLISSVSEMQVTLARLDERMASVKQTQDGRMTDFERRLSQVEAQLQDETKKGN